MKAKSNFGLHRTAFAAGEARRWAKPEARRLANSSEGIVRIGTLLLLAVAVLAGASTAPADSPTGALVKDLASGDSAVAQAAAKRLVQGAATADPFYVMAFAAHLFDAGHRDQAVFWFYAGQLRARYMREVSGEAGQILTAYIMASESINAYAMSDTARFRAVAERVLAWDETTFDDWAWEHDVYFRDANVRARREGARNGLVGFVREVQAKRDEREKRGREHAPNEANKTSASPPRSLSALTPAAMEPLPPVSPAQRSTLYLNPGREAKRLGKLEIAPREAPIAGKDAQYWVRRYYEWLEKSKRHASYVQKDTTGELCARGQGGPVWFLTDIRYGKVARTCSIPTDVHVLIPVFEGLLAASGTPAVTCEALGAYARKWVSEAVGVRLAINGQELNDLALYEGSGGCYERETGSKERQKVATHGYWIFLRPLLPGTHRIEFAGQVGGENRFRNLAHDVTYLLTVSAGGSAKEGPNSANTLTPIAIKETPWQPAVLASPDR